MKIRLFPLVFGLALLSCQTGQDPKIPAMILRTQVIMGTDCSVALRSEDFSFSEAVFAKMREVDEMLSSYKSESEVSRLNRESSGRLSPGLQSLLKTSLELSQRTKGAFDVTLGALTLEAYGFSTDHEKVPSKKEKKMAQDKSGYQKLELTDGHLKMPRGMKLDFGGIGKGYAVDLAAEALIQWGVTQGVISASGDVRCLHPCEGAIAHPRDRERRLATFKTIRGNIAFSTSGISERKVKGTKIHHLLDPQSGSSANYFIGVTLLGEISNTLLDGLTTAIFILGEDAIPLLNEYPELGFVLITHQNEVIYNQRFTELVTGLNWLAQDDFRIRQQVIKKAL